MAKVSDGFLNMYKGEGEGQYHICHSKDLGKTDKQTSRRFHPPKHISIMFVVDTVGVSEGKSVYS